MEARTSHGVRIKLRAINLLLPLLFVIGGAAEINAQQMFRKVTQNFVVIAPDANLASKAAELAEEFRRDLAIDWLGYELEPWREKCPIQIEIGPHAGGETSFAFTEGKRSEPIGWQMKIFGPPNRLLDAVLPHEITHTIFATHFGCPLPRWADEGACTTVEHQSERQKNHRMLLQFLTSKPSRGIPFNRMFTMRRYPHDILPLYAQGYSVARFLIEQGGRRHFVKFLEKGIDLEQPHNATRVWDAVTQEYYGYRNLSDLQLEWIAWVRKGSPSIGAARGAIVSTEPSPNSVAGTNAVASNSGQTDVNRFGKALTKQPQTFVASIPSKANLASNANQNSWYVQQSTQAKNPDGNLLRAKTRAPNNEPENSDESFLSGNKSNSGPIFRPGSVGRFMEQKAAQSRGTTSSKDEVTPTVNASNATVWR